MFVEYAEDNWVNISDAVRLEIYVTKSDKSALRVWRRDTAKPEEYVFEGSPWLDYAVRVIRAAAVEAAGEP